MIIAQHIQAQKQGNEFYREVLAIDKTAGISDEERLMKAQKLQEKMRRQEHTSDSTYARLLDRIGLYHFKLENIKAAILSTKESATISTSGRSNCNPLLAVNSFYNLGYFYKTLNEYPQSLQFYNRCIQTGIGFKDSSTLDLVVKARLERQRIYFETGDYQKSIEESTLGLVIARKIKNKDRIVVLLNERAQSNVYILRLKEAANDLEESMLLIDTDNLASKANNYKIRATILESANKFGEAMNAHYKAIGLRTELQDSFSLAGDYLDAGNTLRSQSIQQGDKEFLGAAKFYKYALNFSIATGNEETRIMAFNNLAAISLRKKKYGEALNLYHQAVMATIPEFTSSNVEDNPPFIACRNYSNKNQLTMYLGNKAECLLKYYKTNKEKRFLQAALRTSLLTDSVITDMRHELSTDTSKLYWRNETRDFFTYAIESCFEANDAENAFYFMEKSKSVLLNDKLNEMGASSKLPPDQAMQEEEMKINVSNIQQELSLLSLDDAEYRSTQERLYVAREELDRFIRKLHNQYPALYQYKYQASVPKLKTLQRYLKSNEQQFVHYFITDSIVYMLAIFPGNTQMVKKKFPKISNLLQNYLYASADVQLQNNQYKQVADLSYQLFQLLFKPLNIKGKRVIICTDGIAVPFESLTKNKAGTEFLVMNYGFSYVYSAEFLLKDFKNPDGRGNFLGVAPVNYASYLQVNPLLDSRMSLNESGSYFTRSKLITDEEASSKNFLRQLPRYRVVAVFSHALAENPDAEPVLFMTDSMVRVSELQRIRNASTQLIILSACETNAGKLFNGEGIFSLSRGFAAAGIPSITGTLWKADESAIYEITRLFLQNVSTGMRKDDALQEAKKSYMQAGSNRNRLPYYWANMILAGNGEPVKLNSVNPVYIWLAAFVLMLVAGYLINRNRKNKQKTKGPAYE